MSIPPPPGGWIPVAGKEQGLCEVHLRSLPEVMEAMVAIVREGEDDRDDESWKVRYSTVVFRARTDRLFM